MPSIMSRCRLPLAALLLGTALSMASGLRAVACPFCSAVSVTLGEELKGASAAVIAKLVSLPPAGEGADANAPPISADSKAKFEIVDVLKGKEHLDKTREIEVLYFGQDALGKKFLIMGTDTPNIAWATPIPLTDRAVEYVAKLPSLPESGADRLAFFQGYFEDPEEMLARDAYDEFAKAPYAELKELKPKMQHDKLVDRIKNPAVPPSRRRLYLTMLGVCGSRDDLPLLEATINSDDRELKTALDAIVACYLSLGGVPGMPLVEDRFLKNPNAEYTDTYAAIMALRFHGQEEHIIPRERIVAALRLMLDRPQLADLVIPDLARWEDWSAMDRLVTLFKDANDETSWVRVPVINYLKACPLPRAKEYLDELAKIDPEAMKRANSFFPLAGANPPPVPVPDGAQPSDATSQPVAVGTTDAAPSTEASSPAGETTAKAADAEPAGVDVTLVTPDGPITPVEPASAGAADAAEAVRDHNGETEKRADGPAVASAASDKPRGPDGAATGTPAWLVVVVPIVGGALLLGLLMLVLRGQRRIST